MAPNRIHMAKMPAFQGGAIIKMNHFSPASRPAPAQKAAPLFAALMAWTALLVCAGGNTTTAPIRLLWIDGTHSRYQNKFQDALNAWSSRSGIPAIAEFSNTGTLTVNEYSGILDVLRDQRKSSWDIVFIDVIWPAVYTDLLTPLDSYLSPTVVDGFAPGLTDAATVNGSLYALPFSSSASGLFYRKDLLDKYNFTSPPTTWSEAEQIMSFILPREHALGNTQLSGYAGQFAPYEGLTCNIMELLGTAGGLVDPDGTLSTMSDPTASARILDTMRMLRRWIDLGFISESALHAREDESARAWQTGRVIFMRNWNVRTWIPVQGGGISALAPLPGRTPDTLGQTTNGAHYYGVNKYSRNIPSAVKVLEFVTSDDAQWWWVNQAGHSSSRKQILTDPRFCHIAGTCELQNLKPVSRPSAATGAKYPQVSTLLYTHWSNMLTGRISPEETLDRLTWDMATLLDINLLGPPVTVEWASPVGVVTIIITSIAQVLTITAGFPLINSKGWSREQRRASPKLIMTLLAGVALMNTWPLVFLGSPATLTCMLRPTLPGFAWAVVLSIMAVQDLQVYLVVASPLRTVAADVHRQMRLFLLGVLLLQVGLTSLYLGLATPQPTIVKIGREYQYAGCAWSSVSWMGQESAFLTLNMPMVLLAINSLLAARLTVIEKVSAVHRVPVLRIVYLILVLSLVSITALAIDRISPTTRILILSGVILIQTIGITRLYVLPRVVPDTSVTSLAWMGETNVGMTSDGRRRSIPASLSHGFSINDGASRTSKNVELLKSSFSFTYRIAVSARQLDFRPSVACVVTLIRDTGMLLLVEAHSHNSDPAPTRLRSVFSLHGRLLTVEPTAQHIQGGCVTQSLRLTFQDGQVVELSSSGAHVVANTISEWRDELRTFAESAEESPEIL